MCEIDSGVMANSYRAKDVDVHRRVEVINHCLLLTLGV